MTASRPRFVEGGRDFRSAPARRAEMAKQDYYATLGVAREASARGPEEGLSQARDAVPPRPQSGRQEGRGAVQGGQRGLRRPEGRSEARRLRSLRPRRVRAGRRPAASARASTSRPAAASATSSTRCSATSWAAARRRAGADRAPAPTFAQAVEIDLAEAFTGTKAQLRVPTRVACEACTGTGSEDKDRGGGDLRRPASGAGKVRAQQGFFLIERTCPTCGGAGPGDPQSLPRLPRRRHGAARAHAAGGDPGRRRGRHAHPPGRRGRGRRPRARRPAISTCTSRSGRIRSSSATAPTSSCACRCA